MQNEKFKPLIDKLFYIIFIPTSALLLLATAFACFAPVALLIMLPVDIFTFYFMLSPLFGYAELREDSLFVKFGFIMKRDIPYEKIRGVKKERKLYSESMTSLKNAVEHVNIKYNSFDVITISVVDNDKFIEKLQAKISK